MDKIKLSDHFTRMRLLRFTLPSIAMMIVTSVYSVVDGYFVSNFAGKTAFAAVNLVMPCLMIAASPGFIFGTGGTALVSKTLGEKEDDRAQRLFSLIVATAFAAGVFIAILGQIFARDVVSLLGATGDLASCSVLYARVILLALPFFTLQLLFQTFFPAAQKPRLGLWVTLGSGVTNIVLDALACFLLPEESRLLGCAAATATAELAGGLYPVIYFARKNDSLLKLVPFSFDGSALWKTCSNGVSEFMNSIAFSTVDTLYNVQLMAFAGEDGIAAYGIMLYASMIFSAVYMGYSMGSAPIASYHYGARDKKELKSILQKSLSMIGACGVIVTLLAHVLAYPVGAFFVGYDAKLLDLTVSGFRIFSLSFLLMGFSMYASSFFTALGDGPVSAVISFLRTLVFEVGCVLILPRILGIEGIWFSVVVAEIMSVLLSAFFLVLGRKKYGY